jgi:hypothetical protein
MEEESQRRPLSFHTSLIWIVNPVTAMRTTVLGRADITECSHASPRPSRVLLLEIALQSVSCSKHALEDCESVHTVPMRLASSLCHAIKLPRALPSVFLLVFGVFDAFLSRTECLLP